MNNEYTHIAIVLDKSGSMGSTLTDTIGGFNTFLEDQKKLRAAGGCDCITCTCQPDD